MTRRLAAPVVAATAIAVALIAGCSADTGTDPAAAPTSSNSAARTPARAQQFDPNSQRPAAPTAPTASRAPAIGADVPDDLAGVVRADPAAVADAVVRTWFTWDTAVDAGPGAGAARAGGLMSEALRTRLTDSGSVSPGGQWLAWAQADARTTAELTVTSSPPPTEELVRRMYQVTVTAVDPSGTVLDTTDHVVATTVVPGPQGWEVDIVSQL